MSNLINRRTPALAAACGLALTAHAQACDYHAILGLPEPVGIWPTDNVAAATTNAAKQLLDADAAEAAALNRIVSSSASSDSAVTNAVTAAPDVTVTNWLINTTGVKGRSSDFGINDVVSKINANVQQVRYTDTDTYIKVTSIPDYNMGPFNNIPNTPANANATFKITRTPQVKSGTKTATGGGAIGVLLNGVEVFNASDQQSFNNQNVWHGNAGVAEAPSLDASYSHPQQQGTYHTHASPTLFNAEVGASSSSTKLLGFAIDGFPIYSSYAPLNTDGTGPIVAQTSSYQLRNITNRTTLADGTVLTGAQRGPLIDANHPLGYYQEDYQYVAGSGLLDQYNGRFIVTPEYPQGTYAYFASVSATTGAPTYPYYVGPSYNGVVVTDNLPGSTIVVPADSIAYVPEPTGMLLTGAIALLLPRRSRKEM